MNAEAKKPAVKRSIAVMFNREIIGRYETQEEATRAWNAAEKAAAPPPSSFWLAVLENAKKKYGYEAR